MVYNLQQTIEAKQDVRNFALYMIFNLKNAIAADNFLIQYEKQLTRLLIFPHAYRDIGYTYQGYAIRMKPFLTYNIFCVIDETAHQVTILRILKNRQDWKYIICNTDDSDYQK